MSHLKLNIFSDLKPPVAEFLSPKEVKDETPLKLCFRPSKYPNLEDYFNNFICRDNIKRLEISVCANKNYMILDTLINCPYVESIKLYCNEVRDITDPDFNNETCEIFSYPYLENLSTFEFESNLRTNPNAPKQNNLMQWHVNVVKEIIKASGHLKHLGLCTDNLAYYLELMTNDSDLVYYLTELHTLKLQGEWCDVKGMFEEKYLFEFLLLVSSTLEILHLSEISWTELTSYPTMDKLRILSIKSNDEYRNMCLSTISFPQLSTLILDRSSVNRDLKWPFCTPTEVNDLDEFIWKDDIKCYVIDSFKEEPSYQVRRPMNVVLYVDIEMRNWKENLHEFFKQLFRVNVLSLFIYFPEFSNDFTLKEQYICKRSRANQTLKHCVINDKYGDARDIFGPQKDECLSLSPFFESFVHLKESYPSSFNALSII